MSKKKEDKRKGRKVYSRRKVNEYIEKDNHYVMLIKSKGKEHKSKIDKSDYDLVKDYKWCLNHYGYAVSERSGKENGNIFLHQLIFGKKEGRIIDHINREELDNRRKNLRYATKQTNSMNSKVIGISYRKDTKKWSAMIVIDGKRKFLGCFEEYKDALNTRKEAEKELFLPIIKKVQYE